MKKKVMIVWLLCCAIYAAFAADDTMLTGLDAYSRGDWTAAAAAFEQAAETQPENRTEALYWLVMAETSAEQYPRALSYADVFLAAAPGDERAAEVRYQKGRILHLSGSYKDSSEVMYQFIKDYPDHPKVPSAYYWIGENLYAEGLYADARKVFAALVVDYPGSGKVSEARYKIVLIDQQAVRSELAQIVSEAQGKEDALSDAQSSAAANTTDTEAPVRSEEAQRRDEEIADRLKALEEKIDALSESLLKMAAEQESLRVQEQQAALERQQREQAEKDRAIQEQQEKQKQAAEARQKELEELRQQSHTLEQLYKQRTKGAQ